MKSKPTITIGIPAYNEEANISYLLLDLTKQKSYSYVLQKIIVISDGSTDNTAKAVRRIRNSKIILLDYKNNKGVATRQNEIMKMSATDILVMINGDIRIKNCFFIERLVKPIIDGEAELTSPNLKEFSPRTFFELVLLTGKKLRRALFESWRDSQNGYLCQGAARAFSKKFYKKLHFADGGGEDMYSYLKCVSLKFRFRYVSDTIAFLRHPKTFRDHFKQSVRFFKYQKKLAKQFSKEIINTELNIPFSAHVKGVIKALPIVIRYPFHVICYLFIVFIMRVRSNFFVNSDSLWNSTSTKR